MKATDRWVFVSLLLCFISYTMAASCNATHKCPESSPCCSQYGECGVGTNCLGGCDIRYSFNLSSCMPMPRMSDMSTSFENDIDSVERLTNYLGNSSEADWVYTGNINHHDDALLIQMRNNSGGTVVSSTKYLWYGKVSCTMKSSRDRGVVSAFIMFSDVQDEIDFEAMGYDLTRPQSNFYYQGDLNLTNARNSSASNTYENYHTYTFDWTEEELSWYLDGEKVRSLKRDETYNETTKSYMYPQTPSRIQLSLWPAGASSNDQGTIEWAGGPIDWDSDDVRRYGYYYSYIKNVTVEAYDLPDDVETEGGDDDSLHAFLYNSTDGNQENIYLTNKKTWLGDEDATGLDPQNDSDDDNDDDDDHSSHSGSSSSTRRGTRTNGGTRETSTTAASTNTGIGGFVQNSRQTSTGSSDSSGGVSLSSMNMVGILLSLVSGIAYFVL